MVESCLNCPLRIPFPTGRFIDGLIEMSALCVLERMVEMRAIGVQAEAIEDLRRKIPGGCDVVPLQTENITKGD